MLWSLMAGFCNREVQSVSQAKNYDAIPFVDLHSQHQELRDELCEAFEGLLESSAFILGPEVQKFEEALSSYLDDVPVIACSSGTSALNLAANALDLEPGDEVITVANTWISTVFAISLRGATPVFVDVDRATGQMQPDAAIDAITDKTKAIFAVHLFGHPAPIDRLLPVCREKNIALVEDAAQALGSRLNGQRVGTLGDIACFSFYPGKNLGALGDAGAVAASNPDTAARLRRLVDYGQESRHHHTEFGFNSRMDSLQAAFLNAKLKRYDEWNARRRDLALTYREALSDLPVSTFVEAEHCETNYHLFVIQTERRDECLNWLRDNGVMAQVHYPTPVHLQPCYRHLGLERGSLPVTEELADTILSLPMSPHLRPEQIRRVVDVLGDFFR